MKPDEQLELAYNTPFYGHLGITLTDVGEGFAKLQLDFKDHLTHPFGYYHGGVIASLADSAGINAVLTTLSGDEKALTLEMKINYLKPAKDCMLYAEGRVIHKGNKFVVSEVDVKNEYGDMVAKAIVTCALF